MEARDFSRLDTARIIRYREEKKQFAGEQYDSLYAVWVSAGDSAVLPAMSPEPAADQLIDQFSTHVLDYGYDLFGSLTSAME